MIGLRELVIELTDRCPLNCMHCSSNSSPDCCTFLSMDTVKALLDEVAAGNRQLQISFGGGEPTLAPNFLEIAGEVGRYGFKCEVFTCGVAFRNTQNHIALPQKFLAEISNISPTPILVFGFLGLHSVHDSITGMDGSFASLIESLQKALSLGIPCSANFVPTKISYLGFHDLILLLESLGVPKLSVLRFVPQGRGLLNRNQLELTLEEENRFITDLLAIRDKARIMIRTGSPFNGIIPDNNVPCRAGFHKLVIQSNGNVLPCEVFKHQGRCNWGATINKMSIKEILELLPFKELRESLVKNRCIICPIHSQVRSKQ
jgi:radical SAM protein with 4Fe4S-binding SPASM domain